MADTRRNRQRRLEDIGREMLVELATIRDQLEAIADRKMVTPRTRDDLRDVLGRVDDAHLVLSRELDRSSSERPWLRRAIALGGSAGLLVGGWAANVAAGEVSQHLDLRNPIVVTRDAAGRTADLAHEAETADRLTAKLQVPEGMAPSPLPEFQTGSAITWSVEVSPVSDEEAQVLLTLDPGETGLPVRRFFIVEDSEGAITEVSERELGEAVLGVMPEVFDGAISYRPRD